ncbi:hypothetical protein F4814DRAFT_458242 [Daldinia grandis]|nr:hypothetical protein F4814DRAFT_458242 [Daldinia grandis]
MAGVGNPVVLIVLSWTLGSLVILLCVTRVWARIMVIDKASWDDIFMTLAGIFAIACSILVTVAVHYGLGKRIDTISDPYSKQMAVKYTIIAPTVSIVSSTLSKVSILIFLTRLMGVSATRRHFACLWTLGAILVIGNLIAIVILLRFCVPIEKQWRPEIEGSCINPKIHAAGATIAKVYCMHAYNLGDHHDITWSWASIAVWYICEMDVIIIVGTIPTLWPVLKTFVKGNGGSSDNSGPYQNVSGTAEGTAEGTEAFRLSDMKGGKRAGPATRVLRDIDNMHTPRAWDDNGEA